MIAGDPDPALGLFRALARRGIRTSLIKHAGVPAHQSRVRAIVTADHELSQREDAATGIGEVWREMGLGERRRARAAHAFHG